MEWLRSDCRHWNRSGCGAGTPDPSAPSQPKIVAPRVGGRCVGKTHLAATFAREFLSAGGLGVLWIVAEDPADVVVSLAELARQAGIAVDAVDAADVESVATSAVHWLEQSTEPILLVLDNALDPERIAPWLPQRGVTQVLITSTNQDFAILEATVQVGGFTEDETVTFLCARAGRLVVLTTEVGCGRHGGR